MAPSRKSYHSQEMIDVSHNAQSPATSTAAQEQARPDDPPEVIEDSLPDRQNITAGGAIEAPQHAAADDDDLYSVTPNRKTSMQVSKPAPLELVRGADIDASMRGGPVGGTPLDDATADKLRDTAMAGSKAMDELLNNGATARPPQDDRRKSKTKEASGAVQDAAEQRRRLQAEPSRAQTKPAATTKQPMKADDSAAQTQALRPSSATGSAPVGLSAVAALKAKKAEKAGVHPSQLKPERQATPANHPAPPKASAGAGAMRAVLQERDQNTQTPAPTKAKGAGTEQPPTTGKLQSRKLGMFAQTPMHGNGPPHVPEQKAPATTTSREARADSEAPKVTSNRAPGTLKRPSKATSGQATAARSPLAFTSGHNSGKSTAARRPTYDVPDDSPRRMPPTKKHVARDDEPKGARKKPATGSKAKPHARDGGTAKRPTAASKRPAKVADSDSYQPPAPKSHRKQPPRRAKVGVKREQMDEDDESDEDEDDEEEPAEKDEEQELDDEEERVFNEVGVAGGSGIPKAAGTAAEPQSAATAQSKGLNETIQDFEAAMVDFDDDDDERGAQPEHVGQSKNVPTMAERLGVNEHIDKGKKPMVQHDAATVTRKYLNAAGASQEQAIVLSDREESSSPARSSPAAVTGTAPAVTTKPKQKNSKTAVPTTPAAAFRSSPPYAGTKNLQTRTTDAKRPTIVSFDRSGPRNQGTMSAKKAAMAPALTEQTLSRMNQAPSASDAGSARARLTQKRMSGASSVAGSMRTTRTERVAPPSNVAEDVGDALAGFLPTKPAKMPAVPTPRKITQDKQSKTARPEPIAQPLDEAAYDDDDFTLVDDAQLAPSVNAPLTQPSAPTASQTAMPPPAPKPAKKKMSIVRAPTVPSMDEIRPDSALNIWKPYDSGTKKYSSKRANEDDAGQQGEVKKRKVAEPAFKQPEALAMSRGDSVSVTTDTVDKPMPAPSQQAAKRAHRKPSRHASQNVDRDGSPIPPNMVVPGNATALEIFSQQADLSSDKAQAPVADAVKRQTSHAPPIADPSFFDAMVGVPSHQPEVLSSNEKRKPASPREDSRAITSIALSRVDPNKLIIREDTALPPTDPFTSSEEERKEPTKGSISSDMVENMRRLRSIPAKQHREQHRSDASDEDDEELTLVQPEPVPMKSKPTKKRRSEAIDEDDQELTLVEPEPAPKKSKPTKKRRSEAMDEDDPDKTLVEPEPVLKKPKRVVREPSEEISDTEIEHCLRRVARDAIKRDETLSVNEARKRAETELGLKAGFLKTQAWAAWSKDLIQVMYAESQSPEQLSDGEASETSPSEPAAGVRKFDNWREGLQPHQMNLFDELVGVSHKLVRYLVDEETAMREMIQDYRREGMTLIKQMEAARAREYQVSLQKLDKRKKELRSGFETMKEDLKKNADALSKARVERARKTNEGDAEERRLEEMLAQYH